MLVQVKVKVGIKQGVCTGIDESLYLLLISKWFADSCLTE